MIKARNLKRSQPPTQEEYLLAVWKKRFKPDVSSRWDTPPLRFFTKQRRRYQGWRSLSELPALRTNLPREIHNPDGSVNSVLAKAKKAHAGCSNWQICNTAYYRLHPYEYHGWIALENLT